MNIALWAALLRVFCIVSVHATALVVLFHRSAHAQGLIRAEVDGSVGGVTQCGRYIDRNLPLARANLGITILAAGSVAPIFTLGIESLGWGRGPQAMTGQCLPTPDGRCHASYMYLPSLTGVSALAGVRIEAGPRTALRFVIGGARFHSSEDPCAAVPWALSQAWSGSLLTLVFWARGASDV
jgi:hypothetical protein